MLRKFFVNREEEILKVLRISIAHIFIFPFHLLGLFELLFAMHGEILSCILLESTNFAEAFFYGVDTKFPRLLYYYIAQFCFIVPLVSFGESLGYNKLTFIWEKSLTSYILLRVPCQKTLAALSS